jgi:hypothetical protein
VRFRLYREYTHIAFVQARVPRAWTKFYLTNLFPSISWSVL